MFNRNVDSIVGSLTEIVDDLRILMDKEYKKHDVAISESQRALKEAGRASRIIEKLEGLIS